MKKAKVTYDANGDPVKAIGFTQDVTQRKQSEKEREQLIAKLEDRNAELERFTYPLLTRSVDIRIFENIGSSRPSPRRRNPVTI